MKDFRGRVAVVTGAASGIGRALAERFASLDHAIWLHAPARWDDWWLVTTRSDIAAAGRALTQRQIYTRDGRLIATIAQEALIGEHGGAAPPAA